VRARKGGSTIEVGCYPITIIPTSKAEVGELRRWATKAVLRMEPRPNLHMPHLDTSIILSYRDKITAAQALAAFKAALEACQSEP